MGIPPSILWGRRRQSLVVNGAIRSDPEWLQLDYALLVALDDWEQNLCPVCGKPVSTHEGKTPDDYAAAFLTCPAVVALDKEQAKQGKRDGNEHASTDPNRPRSWFVDTTAVLEAMAREDQARRERAADPANT